MRAMWLPAVVVAAALAGCGAVASPARSVNAPEAGPVQPPAAPGSGSRGVGGTAATGGGSGLLADATMLQVATPAPTGTAANGGGGGTPSSLGNPTGKLIERGLAAAYTVP